MLFPYISKAQIANRFEVVITEIMADPTPVAGLPNAEYIEIKNVSASPFNLNGWKISDATSTATLTANFVLQPDSFLIICANSNVAALSVYGRTIGVSSFPSLDNSGDQLSLKSVQGKIIHAVNYATEWYQNEIKKDGGWSLEMIDTKNPCTGMVNWIASIDASGGTPGKKNSVDGVNKDSAPPQLLRTYSPTTLTLTVVFNEPLDSASAAAPTNYFLNNGINITSAAPQGTLFNTVLLNLSSPMQPNTVYTLTAANVTDCKGNIVGAYNKAKAGLPEEALQADLIINEILFNSRPNAYDYVEFYNKSAKIIDAGKLFLANRNSSGALSSIKKIMEVPFYIFPGDYIVVTEDAASLKREYLVNNPDAVLQLLSLPSLPDDKGNIVLTNAQGFVVDEVAYADKWHFALISNTEGVALERIDPADSSQKSSNWHSASSTAGYGTPSYRNSQYKQTGNIQAEIEITPRIFSPDNDGQDDIARINYQVQETGYLANLTIFDAGGRTVRRFVKNGLLGLKGSWNWDGLDEKNQKLPIGTYVVYTEIFNLQGKKKHFKNTVVLARKFN